jgi:uncharacterized protein YegL
MKDNLTSLALIIDRSGSMGAVRQETIGGINAFLKEQRELDGEVRITIAQFDTYYDIIHDYVDISEVKDFTEEDFVPRGMTALLDGIGKTITDLGVRFANMNEDERPANVVACIITDGEENSSKEYNVDQIKTMIETQEDVYNWDVTFMGAGLDTIDVANSYGIKGGKSLVYDTGKMDVAFDTMSKSVLRARGGLDVTYTSAEVLANAPDKKTLKTTT